MYVISFKAFIVLQALVEVTQLGEMNSVLLKNSNTEGGQARCLMREREKKYGKCYNKNKTWISGFVPD